MGTCRAGRRSELGANLVECGLLLPLLLMLLFMVIELSRLLWVSHAVTAAAAEGTRLAILNEPSDDEVRSWIRRQLSLSGVDVEPDIALTPRTPGQPVSTTVRVGFRFIVLPAFLSSVAGLNTVAATSTMEHEP